MDRNLALEFVRITEAAAIASAHLMGRGDGNAADQAAVDAMRKAFDRVDMDGTVVIGEGERDEARSAIKFSTCSFVRYGSTPSVRIRAFWL